MLEITGMLAGKKMIADLLMTKTSVDALSVKFFKDADADTQKEDTLMKKYPR
ncbi:hypothetical protein AAHB65_27725 [Bacillus toyonensis]